MVKAAKILEALAYHISPLYNARMNLREGYHMCCAPVHTTSVENVVGVHLHNANTNRQL